MERFSVLKSQILGTRQNGFNIFIVLPGPEGKNISYRVLRESQMAFSVDPEGIEVSLYKTSNL